MRHHPDPPHFPAGAALSAPGCRVNEVVELGGRPLFPGLSSWTLPFVHFSVGIRTPAGFLSGDGMTQGLPRWRSGKESTCSCRSHRRHGFDPWIGKIHWRRRRHSTVFAWKTVRGVWWAAVQGVTKSQA